MKSQATKGILYILMEVMESCWSYTSSNGVQEQINHKAFLDLNEEISTWCQELTEKKQKKKKLIFISQPTEVSISDYSGDRNIHLKTQSRKPSIFLAPTPLPLYYPIMWKLWFRLKSCSHQSSFEWNFRAELSKKKRKKKLPGGIQTQINAQSMKP